MGTWPDWIIAFATVAYTIGTYLLWRSTQATLTATRNLFRLNLLVEYYRAQSPAPNVGHPWETREVSQRIEELGKKQTEAMRQAFPELRDIGR
jgi:hypothetical protein